MNLHLTENQMRVAYELIKSEIAYFDTMLFFLVAANVVTAIINVLYLIRDTNR